MDRSAHVWGKYKALLTVISSYNWWVVFHYISFSWLTAFLKSPLNGKLIGWLNLHFNQSIYDGGSPRNSLAEGEATFPEGLQQEWALECVYSPIPSLVICLKGSVVGEWREHQWPLQHWPRSPLISCRKGHGPGEGNPVTLACLLPLVVKCCPTGSNGGSQASAPRAPSGRERHLGQRKGNTQVEPASHISHLGWKPSQAAPRRLCKRPQPWIQRHIDSCS